MKTHVSPVYLKIRGLGQGDTPISLAFDASLLEYPDFSGIANLTGVFHREGETLDLKGKVSSEGHFDCTRCAEPFSDTISANITLHFVPAHLTPNEGDPNVHTYDPLAENEIDILPDLRDALILAVPMRHLCKPNCKGLCPNCGKNWNTEPCNCHEEPESASEWAALNRLRERLRAEENFKNN
ncbi:MAG TPA: DUF177 domain-containing protein [Candidatus Kapabacteria bacterium]